MSGCPPTAPTPPSSGVFGWRLLAACAALVGLAFVQDPGLLAADTKFDLVAAPFDWLARSLHVWDAEGFFGQVQNQAHGYLFPLGPFFLVGTVLDLPGWVVQRLWQGVVMSVALVGAARLARALGVRSDAACLVAGFAFALSPRMLTSLGPISIEVWPSAVAPWVLLPLVLGARDGSPRRAAALSALAVGAVGGVNAAATVAVLPLGAVWLLTRTRGRATRSMMLWWPFFTFLATAWWVLPLLVMGAYSPPFLDFTETTAVTTFPTTIFDTLRGTVHWVPYVDPGSRAGDDLIRSASVALNSGVLVFLGLVGLLHRRTPHRSFLVLALVVGLLLVTAGHQGAVQGWWAGPVADLLDGALAPLRNVHKFDVVVRLPLVLGLGFVVDRAVEAQRRAEPRHERFNHAVLVAVAALAVVGTALPAVSGRIEPAGATAGVPGYWAEAADFLADESEGGTALLVPGSGFAEYTWGDTSDEPLQWLAGSRWAVRNASPLTPPGTIRMLDGLEQRLAQGEGSRGFTEALARAGIEHLVVRNDLARDDDVPAPSLVHQAIQQSPGLERVATFGPEVGGDASFREGGARVVVDDGREHRYPAVEVFAVTLAVEAAVSTGSPTLLAAGPEDLPDLLDLGVLGNAPALLGADTGPDTVGTASRVVLTDGLRAREREFGRLHDATSPTLGDADLGGRAVTARDYRIDSEDRWSTRSVLEGARDVRASSSVSDAGAPGGSQRGGLPYAAVDRAGSTAWRSGFAPDERAWWRVDLDGPRDLDELTVTGGPDLGDQVLRAVTENGETATVRLSPGGTRRLLLPRDDAGASTTSWLRIEEASDAPGRPLQLAEVDAPGLDVRRLLELPVLPEAWGTPDSVVLRADRDGRTGCVEVVGEDRCAALGSRGDEEGRVLRRRFELDGAREYASEVTARPRAGARLDDLVLRRQPAAVRASSLALPDPRAGAVSAIDGRDTTTWLADPDDEQPELTLSWLGRRTVTRIDLDVDPSTAARLPVRVVLETPGRGRSAGSTASQEVDLGPDGAAVIDPVRTDVLRVRVLEAEPVTVLGSRLGTREVPVGISEVRLGGVPYFPVGLSADERRYSCGTGPAVEIAGTTSRTALVASPLALQRGVEVPARVCGSDVVRLGAGEVDVAVEGSSAADVSTLVLSATDDPGARPVAHPAGLELLDAVNRVVRPVAGDDVVVMRENTNPGWSAVQGGEQLAPVTLDGWQQGFALEGDEELRVEFAPDRTYRAGLVAGGLGLLLLLAGVLLTRRRFSGPATPAVGDRSVPGVVAAGGALLLGGLLAGWVGVVLAGACALLVVLAPRNAILLPWLGAAPVLVAAAAYGAGPWGSDTWAGTRAWVGYLSVVPVAVLLAGVGRPRSGNRLLSRIAGRSMKR